MPSPSPYRLQQEAPQELSTGDHRGAWNSRLLPEPQFVVRRNMIVDRDFEHVLEKAGLDGFDAIMGCEQGVACAGGPPGRYTVAVAIPEASGTTALYLTRYEETLASRMLRKGVMSRKRCSVIKEWRTILALRDHNLPVAVPIAVGIRRRPALVTESFLVTLGPAHLTTVRNMMEGDLRRHVDRSGIERKRRFLSSLAVMLRRMHEQGFKTRDLYFSQILINWGNTKGPMVTLGNVHSITKRFRKIHYWQTGDLASLNSAAPEAVFSRSDRLWFLHQYDATLARDRSFIKALARKTRRIQIRKERHRNKLAQFIRTRNTYAF